MLGISTTYGLWEEKWPIAKNVGFVIRWSPSSGPALAACWFCSRSSPIKIHGHTCKQPTGCLMPVGALNSYVAFDLFVSKHLSGAPVNQLYKLSALSTINKPLNLFLVSSYLPVDNRPICGLRALCMISTSNVELCSVREQCGFHYFFFKAMSNKTIIRLGF